MGTLTAISIEEYLRSSYRPDCDYVDGELVERNVGEWSHSLLQSILSVYLNRVTKPLRARVATELRMRVNPARFRIPDLAVILRTQRGEPVLTHPPFLCIEIVSPEDRMSRIIERVKDYLAFGVNYVWVIDPDPASRSAYCYTKEEGREVRDRLTTHNPEISVSVPEIFAELDEALREEA